MPSSGATHDEQQRLAEHAASRIARSGALASAAPAKPPISACDDDDGRPHHHVSRFHTIAPSSVAEDHVLRHDLGRDALGDVPRDTCVGNTRNATKLKNAAHTTAARGESTRVETTVAIEFAAS